MFATQALLNSARLTEVPKASGSIFLSLVNPPLKACSNSALSFKNWRGPRSRCTGGDDLRRPLSLLNSDDQAQLLDVPCSCPTSSASAQLASSSDHDPDQTQPHSRQAPARDRSRHRDPIGAVMRPSVLAHLRS
ncbi:hypothetical protein DY000_02019377 [Brassica cretica]|uniref:Uncharacterized protein n=1 Tax=Brassica cretica TaxID=69181 RepID=A0ABQ7DCH5_BRACR|nr:hypothetical protein DY000_02019377 [Brassica cretica]